MSLSKLHDIKKPSQMTSSRQPETLRRPPVSSPRNYTKSHSNSSGKGIWYIAFILIIGLFFGLSVFFTGAKVVVTPVIENTPLNERFIAHKKSVSQELTFDAMVVEGSVSQDAQSSEKAVVEEKAVGTVRIFNDHGSEAQPLRIDTRLVDEKGRIYKTKEAVTVPGQTISEGKTIPGSVDVEIYAEAPGEEYNQSTETTLRLIGFKEAKSPKFDTIYAKTLGPIEGGFVGEKFVVSQEEKDVILSSLTEELTVSLIEKSKAQVREQTIFPEKLSVLIDTNLSEQVAEDGTIKLTLSGKLFNVLFNSVEFEKYILETSIVGVDQDTAYIANINELNISYVDPVSQTVNPEALENLAFQIDDVLEIISVVNKETLAFDLVGQKKKDFQSIIANHPGIQHVEYDINPFWRPSFPDSDEDIEIILTTEEEV